MNIYVGNLPFSYTDKDLESLFSPYGQVASARVVMDRDTGRARGFGFVEMPDKAQAEASMLGLKSKDVGGRTLTVNESKPREGGAGARPASRGAPRW